MGADEIEIYQGSAKKLEFTILKEDGDPLDLTNFDVMKFMVKANKDDADVGALLSKVKLDMVIVAVTQGRVDLQLEGDDTKGITVGQNYYELLIEDTGNNLPYTVLQDYFTVLERVPDTS